MKKKYQIACLGDSLTYGYGIWPYDVSKVWTGIIEKQCSIKMINAGMPGISLLEQNGYWNSSIYLKTMKKNPDAIIFWLGENDSSTDSFDPEAFRKGYMLMTEELLEHVERQNLLLMTTIKPCPGIQKDVYDFGIRKEVLVKIDQIITYVSDYFGVSCLHPDSIFKDHPEFYNDDIHPNEEGNQVLAEMIINNWIKNV